MSRSAFNSSLEFINDHHAREMHDLLVLKKTRFHRGVDTESIFQSRKYSDSTLVWFVLCGNRLFFSF